ncbi:MAG: MG2 domain-containing protein [Pseudomonas sp.]|uniref:alpha-2-macroglobulin family protein n=1 Tax=Pseudomonas sp. TaxID=306 RepID=UPI0033915049
MPFYRCRVAAALLWICGLASLPAQASVAAPEAPASPAAETPREAALELFTPQGEMRTVRQVQVRFSENMVRFGDPRLSDPFTLACSVPGKGRWLDTRNWVYDFDKDLPSGIRCEALVAPGLQTLSGGRVRTEATYSFTTGGPQISDSWPVAGISYSKDPTLLLIKRNREVALGQVPADSGIEESQRFMLKFDGVIDRASVQANAYCLVQGVNERIPARLLDAKEEAGYLATLKEGYRSWWRSVHASGWSEIRRTPYSKAILACQRSFPNDSRVTLVWGRDIASTDGIANAEETLLGYRVRPEFTARFSCYRESARKPCNPLTSMTLEFSEEVSEEVIQNVQLVSASGVQQAAPNSYGDGYGPGRYVQFNGPFVANEQFTLRLPDAIKGYKSARPLKNAGRFPLRVETGELPPLAKFSALFGIIEARVGAVPLTLRNLEPPQGEGRQERLRALRLPHRGAALRQWLGRLPSVIDLGGPFGHLLMWDAVSNAVPFAVAQLASIPGETVKAQLLTLRLPDDEAALIGWLKKAQAFEQQPWDFSYQSTGRQPTASDKPKPVDPRSVSLIAGEPGVQRSPLPRVLGAKAFEVIGIPVPTPGLYVHEVESTYLGRSLLQQERPMYVHSTSLVTDLAVHLKRGASNSLVWVTSLDQGTPIADARVTVHDCNAGELLWSGTTDAQGLARVDAQLPATQRSDQSWVQGSVAQQSCGGASMLVSARKGLDRGFVLSSWDEGIAPWRYDLASLYGTPGTGSQRAHSVLDRSLLRPGETLHMRHVLRGTTPTGFKAPEQVPVKVIIRHQGSGDAYELPTPFDRHGNAEGEWRIPPAAKLGDYSLYLQMAPGSELYSGHFKIAQFRLPLLKARLQLPGGPLAYQPSLDADMNLAYLNGGAFPEAPVTLRGVVDEAFLSFPDYADYSFRTCVDEEGNDLCPPMSDFESRALLDETSSTLDEQGGGRESISIPSRVNPADVRIEMEFADPSGETQTVAASSQYWPADYMPGLKVQAWGKTSDRLGVDVIVLDTQGKVVKDAAVRVDLFLNETISTREKTAGGFYSYNSRSELKGLDAQCQGRSDAQGRLHCDIATTASGQLRLRAVVTDSQGRSGTSSSDTWISGSEPWMFAQQDNDRIDLIPEKKHYAPGEPMQFQVRMPFQQATALVTVEREGIIEARVQQLTSRSPVIVLPSRGDYAPNVFVSALLVRGRDASVAPTATIDLGKPAFKMGLTEVRVGWDAFRLGVKVESDKPRYRIRETAAVGVKVSAPKGEVLPVDTEVTLALVDEALLELASNDSWDLLSRMMVERTLEVGTSTSQLQVVGKRHFGRKAVPSGGGGGKGGATRELFDTLVYWKARATVNSQGTATFNAPLNDSLSGFRLVAIASSTERFGTGQNSIQTYQDLQLISGLPPLVRDGDRFTAGFTLRNASAQSQTVDFSAQAPALAIAPLQQRVVLKAGESRILGFDIEVPKGLQRIAWTLSATTELASDQIKVEQRVESLVPEQVVQGTLAQLSGVEPFVLPLKKPTDALDGGGVEIRLNAHLGDSLGAVQRYFRDYAYNCLEQQTSRAIALNDPAAWQKVVDYLPTYLDDDGFAKLFSTLQRGDPLVTAYVLEIIHESGRELPAATRDRMLGALAGFVSGRLAPPVWNFSPLDDSARKLKAMSVLARYQRFDPVSLDSLSLQPQLWPTAMLLDWLTLLQLQPQLPQQVEHLQQVSGILRTRLSQQGTALQLSQNESNQWWLYSSTDAAAAKLFLAAQTLPGWQDDLPKLLNGLNLRSHNGVWDTTLANAWVTLAMRKFSERFEQQPITGSTRLSLATQQHELPWPAAQDKPHRLDWPATDSALSVRQDGSGKPWVNVLSVARIPILKPWSSGYQVSKRLIPLQQKQDDQWSVGDVALVFVEIDAQTDMGWVVVNDPIPAGASLLGRGLSRDSALLQNKISELGYFDYLREPDFAEYLQDSYRGYYARVGKGRLVAAYVLRLNQAGNFSLPPTRVEAMYAPEMFGLLPNEPFVVKP